MRVRVSPSTIALFGTAILMMMLTLPVQFVKQASVVFLAIVGTGWILYRLVVNTKTIKKNLRRAYDDES